MAFGIIEGSALVAISGCNIIHTRSAYYPRRACSIPALAAAMS